MSLTLRRMSLFLLAGLACLIVLALPMTRSAADISASAQDKQVMTKMNLWRSEGGAHLRGAVIYQRRRYAELDGDSLGRGAVGPAYEQADFDRLAAAGANIVVLSHPGVFTETAPYVLDRPVQANLDRLVAMAARADLFVVIALRTGPGRSEFTFAADQVGTWFGPEWLDDSLWASEAAQEGWVAMWRHLAARYRGHPAVVGYELMVEPNSNHVGADAIAGRLDIWDPAAFEARFGGSSYDWNRLYPRLLAAVRQADPAMPVLVGGNGYSDIAFLSQLRVIADPAVVYVAHSYGPRAYTHQEPGAAWSYREVLARESGAPVAGADWFEALFAPLDRFRNGGAEEPSRALAVNSGAPLPMAMTEFGVVRWAPDAAGYLADQLAALERRGINAMLYGWAPEGASQGQAIDRFDPSFGPDPDNHTRLATTPALEVLARHWQANRERPSNTRFAAKIELM